MSEIIVLEGTDAAGHAVTYSLTVPVTTTDRSGLIPGQYLATAANTGPVTPVANLVVINGSVNFTSDNQIIEGKLILGDVQFTGKNQILRDCLVRGSIAPASLASNQYNTDIIKATSAAVVNALVEDVRVDPSYGAPGGPGTEPIYRTRFARNGFFGHHTTLRRCDIAYTIDCVGVAPPDIAGFRADTVLEACYLHDLTLYSPDSNSGNHTHCDIVQWHGGEGYTSIGNTYLGFFNTRAGDALTPYNATTQIGNPGLAKWNDGGGALMAPGPVGSRDPYNDFHARGDYINGGGGGYVLGSSNPASFTRAGATVIGGPNPGDGCHFGWDYQNGQDYGIMTMSFNVVTIQGNHRWGGPTKWLHGDEFNVDPYDLSTSFNIRH